MVTVGLGLQSQEKLRIKGPSEVEQRTWEMLLEGPVGKDKNKYFEHWWCRVPCRSPGLSAPHGLGRCRWQDKQMGRFGNSREGKGGAESKQTSVSGRFVHTCLEREKTAKPSVTWQPGRISIPRSWDTKIFQPVFCLKLSKGNTANKGCPCYVLIMMQKSPFPSLWVRQAVTTFVSMALGLWSPAGGFHTSTLIFSLHTYACKHVTTCIHTNTHTRTHTCSQQQRSHLDSHALWWHLFFFSVLTA